MDYYLGTLAHEYGHCMGLPDYYKTVNTGYMITIDSVSADQKNCTVTILPDK
ncbi:immune inhibitor A domain-containing protein [Roseburia intestinalis]